jgi:hypothetical protein
MFTMNSLYLIENTIVFLFMEQSVDSDTFIERNNCYQNMHLAVQMDMRWYVSWSHHYDFKSMIYDW